MPNTTYIVGSSSTNIKQRKLYENLDLCPVTSSYEVLCDILCDTKEKDWELSSCSFCLYYFFYFYSKWLPSSSNYSSSVFSRFQIFFPHVTSQEDIIIFPLVIFIPQKNFQASNKCIRKKGMYPLTLLIPSPNFHNNKGH